MGKVAQVNGWQSWTPMGGFFKNILKRPCDFSPHGITKWRLKSRLKKKKPISAWNSWYAYGKNINQEKILKNAQAFLRHSTKRNKYVIIDDGWTKWGDYSEFDKTRFPMGFKKLNKALKKKRLRGGIWIAPFLSEKNSRFYFQKPELFVRHKGAVVEGLRMSALKLPFVPQRYLIDYENEKAREYLKKCLKKIIEDWGFELVKLDFLYAPYFNPVYKNSKVPDEILKDLLLFIKQNYPNVYTIASGAPLGSVCGLVDSVRIGPDIINPNLRGYWPLNRIFSTYRLSLVESALQERGFTKKHWNLDLDAFVGTKSSGLSKTQARKLKSLILASGGNIVFGDDLSTIGNEYFFN